MLTEREFDIQAATAESFERFVKFTVLALRANIARVLSGLDHREFCARLADSVLRQ
jgi:hypothetical protein